MPGAGDKTEGNEPFLSRWARRKEAQRQPTPAADRAAREARPPETAEAAEPPLRVEDLPDIDSLDESSDFTVFLKEGVPASLRRRALRKLWRLNPVFANLDGLNDYDEDFRAAFNFPEGVKTLYQAGKGMIQPEEDGQDGAEDGAKDGAAAAEAEAPGEDAPTPAEGAEAAAALPEPPAEPPAELLSDRRGRVAPTPTEAAPLAAEADRPSPAARGSAVKRRWGAFES